MRQDTGTRLVMSNASTEVMRLFRSSVSGLLIAALASCSSGGTSDDAIRPAKTAKPGLTGADRDEHGCIGSAGYRWCAQMTTCIRPWELAEQEGIENDAEHFDQFCDAPIDDGSGR